MQCMQSPFYLIFFLSAGTAGESTLYTRGYDDEGLVILPPQYTVMIYQLQEVVDFLFPEDTLGDFERIARPSFLIR